jgi:hypothetical protein
MFKKKKKKTSGRKEKNPEGSIAQSFNPGFDIFEKFDLQVAAPPLIMLISQHEHYFPFFFFFFFF